MRFASTIFTLVVLSSCTDPAKEIIGEWRPVRIVSLGEEVDISKDTRFKLEFTTDGRFIPTPVDSSFAVIEAMSYHIKKDTLSFEIMEMSPYNGPASDLQRYFEIDDDILLLKRSDLNYTVYVRERADSAIWKHARNMKLDILPRNSKRDVRDNFVEDNTEYWLPQYPGRPKHLMHVLFREHEVEFRFIEAQSFMYYTEMTSDSTIVMIWPPKEELLYGATISGDVLSDYIWTKSMDGFDPPRDGDSFATLILKDRNTFEVHYNYPEWVAGINRLAGDSLFPNYLRFAGRK